MQNTYLHEMALALEKQLGVRYDDALRVLNDYWVDKITDVWSVANFIGIAVERGVPITREIAQELAENVQGHIDPEQGISWMTLEIAVEDNRYLNLLDLISEQRALVYGVFAVWRAKDPAGYVVGNFDEPEQLGNLTKAMEQAEALALQEMGEPVFVACVGRHVPTNVPPISLNISPALVVYKEEEKDRVTIEDGKFFSGRESMKAIC